MLQGGEARAAGGVGSVGGMGGGEGTAALSGSSLEHSSLARVRLERGAAVESSRVALHVSSNGQQFVRAGSFG